MQPLKIRSGRAFLPWAAIVTLAILTQHAQAQLSSAQQSALRANCRSDFMSHCSGVTPGGKDALVCLQRNVASLSPGCKAVVAATMPPPAAAKAAPPPAAAAPPPPKPATAAVSPPKAAEPHPSTAQKDALSAACSNDYLAHCASVPPGGKEALVCLRQHAMALSVPCKEVLSKMMTPPPERARKTIVRAPPSPPPPAPAAVAAGPTPQQLKAIKFTCRRDFRVHCRGVPTGGREAMACLIRNSARLTPDCRTSIRAIEQSMPMAPATAAAPAAQPTEAQQAALKQNCRGDFPRVCPGVSPGPTALTCLQTHVAELSPACKASVAALGGTAVPATVVVEPAPRRHLPPGVTPVGRILRRVIEHNR
jgi:hypothetical protein